MSRWLKSVNRLLDQLDDQGAAVAEVVPQRATGAARRFFTGQGSEEDYDDDDEDEDYEEEDDDDEEASGEYESDEDDEYEAGEHGGVDSGKEAGVDEVKEEEVEFESQSESSPSDQSSLDRVNPTVAQQPRQFVDSPPAHMEDHHTDDGVLVDPEPFSDETMNTQPIITEQTPSQAVPGNVESKTMLAPQAEHPKEATPLIRDTAHSSFLPPAQPPIVQSKPPPALPTPSMPLPPPRPPPPPSSTGNRSAGTAASAASHNKRVVAPPSDHRHSRAGAAAAAAAELAHLQSVNASLQQRLEAAERELKAQHDELMVAAASLKEERELLKEEKEDLMADHEEELEGLQQQHQDEVKQLHASYQSQLQALQAELREQRSKYQKQGGDLAGDVAHARAERDQAEAQVQALAAQLREVQQASDQLTAQHEALQHHCRGLEEAAETARQSERAAEARADAAVEQHQRQLALRQAREAELEQTVAELSAALTASQQQQPALPTNHGPASAVHGANGLSEAVVREYRAKYELTAEELDTAQSELRVTAQRCEALQREVEELSRERKAEVTQTLQRQRDADARIADLTTRLHQLEAAAAREDRPRNPQGGEEARLRQLLQEADDARKHVAFLSDQLLRQQGAAETFKSEVLALKGRLQAANARADAAEVALAASSSNPHDLEGGSASKARRRIKGGARALWGSRPGHLAPRSVRAALGLRVATGTAMEQVALTVDALDQWMLETGAVLKNEPLARVGLAVYLTMLHCWCFALVFFHAVESEHGDLGTLTHRGGALHPTHS